MNLITKNLSASPLFSLMRDKGNSEGKTWLLNKLFGANLPAGKLCTTKGLSFLWIKERRMLVLDPAGVQSTVSYRAQAVDAIHDAQTTESLMFEMVSRIRTWQNYNLRLQHMDPFIVVLCMLLKKLHGFPWVSYM